MIYLVPNFVIYVAASKYAPAPAMCSTDTNGLLHLYLLILLKFVPVMAGEGLALLIHIQEVLDSI